MKQVMNMVKKNPAALVVALIVAIVVVARMNRSSYKMSPREIQIEGEQPNLFDTPHSLECVPGPQSTAGAYTKSLTPGGFCGMQEKVNQAANYKISGGIGGDLA